VKAQEDLTAWSDYRRTDIKSLAIPFRDLVEVVERALRSGLRSLMMASTT
jgi:hypothetical protein